MGRLCGRCDPVRWGGSWQRLLLAASVLSTCLHSALGQNSVTITVDPQYPMVGGDVTLSAQGDLGSFLLCSWYRGSGIAESDRILNVAPGNNPVYYPGPASTSRETGQAPCSLHITDLMLNYTGSYTVLVTAAIANKVETTSLQVYAMVTKPTVTSSSNEVMENSSFTLTCNVSQESGPVSIFWLKNGVNLTTSNTLQLSEENRTLTVVNVTRNDAGAYQCEPRNLLSYNRSDSINVIVFYGPDSAVIIPPGTITQLLGSLLTLTCRSEGVPELQYRWFHNGTESNRKGNILTIESTSWGDVGNYSCRVENPRTNITALDTMHLFLSESAPSNGLSGGAIAGIVIACVVGVGVIGAIVYFLFIRNGGRTEQHLLNGTPSHNQGVPDNKPTPGDEDIQYSSVTFNANPSKQVPPSALPPENTVYSEIKKK